jgi:predicted nucleic acid-binding protein
MYLIDTVTLSELRRRRRDTRLVAWFERQRTADLFVSVISIGEIERGIAAQRASNPGFAAALARWLDTVLALYGERILPFDLSAARRWGRGPGQRERGPHDCGNGAGARPYRGYSQCCGFRACARSRIESIPASATSFTGVRARLVSATFDG